MFSFVAAGGVIHGWANDSSGFGLVFNGGLTRASNGFEAAGHVGVVTETLRTFGEVLVYIAIAIGELINGSGSVGKVQVHLLFVFSHFCVRSL